MHISANSFGLKLATAFFVFLTMAVQRDEEVTGRDGSDENGCQLMVFKNNYNMKIPPIESATDVTPIPVTVNISITLLKVVEIEETDHSIHLHFHIRGRIE